MNDPKWMQKRDEFLLEWAWKHVDMIAIREHTADKREDLWDELLDWFDNEYHSPKRKRQMAKAQKKGQKKLAKTMKERAKTAQPQSVTTYNAVSGSLPGTIRRVELRNAFTGELLSQHPGGLLSFLGIVPPIGKAPEVPIPEAYLNAFDEDATPE
jgi:hypothetical protein